MLFKKDDYIIIFCLAVIVTCLVSIMLYFSQTTQSITATLSQEQKSSDKINHLTIEKIDLDLDVVEDLACSDYYLHHTITGEESIGGALFYYSNCGNIIYGHNMLNGTMFGRLNKLSAGDIAQVTIDKVYYYKVSNIYHTNNSYFPDNELYNKNNIYLSTCYGEGRTIIELEKE